MPIPFRRVGKHHRLRAEDVINYKNKIDEQRLKTLEELAKQAQELKMLKNPPISREDFMRILHNTKLPQTATRLNELL